MKKIILVTATALLLVAAQSHTKNYAYEGRLRYDLYAEDLKPKFDALPAGGRLEINADTSAKTPAEFLIDNKTPYKVFLRICYSSDCINGPRDSLYLPSNRGVRLSCPARAGAADSRVVDNIAGYIFWDATNATELSNRYLHSGGTYTKARWEVVLTGTNTAEIRRVE